MFLGLRFASLARLGSGPGSPGPDFLVPTAFRLAINVNATRRDDPHIMCLNTLNIQSIFMDLAFTIRRTESIGDDGSHAGQTCARLGCSEGKGVAHVQTRVRVKTR